MGCGPVINGRQWPITNADTAWCTTVNNPIPQHVKDHFADQHAATHTQRVKLPGRVDRFGKPLPSGDWT